MLADIDLVEYELERKTVRYRGNSKLEELRETFIVHIF
jgi:hypothetical protein